MRLLKDTFITEFPKEYPAIEARIAQGKPLTLRQSKLMLYMIEYLKGRETMLLNSLQTGKHYETSFELVSLVGFDALGIQTAAFVCTKAEVKHTAQVLFESYPATEIIAKYSVSIGMQAQNRYIREDVENLR